MYDGCTVVCVVCCVLYVVMCILCVVMCVVCVVCCRLRVGVWYVSWVVCYGVCVV